MTCRRGALGAIWAVPPIKVRTCGGLLPAYTHKEGSHAPDHRETNAQNASGSQSAGPSLSFCWTAMIDSEVTAATLLRTREHSLALCKFSLALMDLSRRTRIQILEARRLRVQTRPIRETVRRESIIARNLRAGRLPLSSVPIINGAPGDGGNCEGCGKPLTSAQLAMAIPSGENTFVHLHADCFMIWNAIRPGTEKQMAPQVPLH